MKRLVIGLLLAATAMAPVVAQAQERRVERQERGPGRLTPEQREQRRAERAARRAERGIAAEDAASRPGRDARPNRRLDGDGLREARPAGMFPRRDGQIFPPTREQRRDARQERREDRRENRPDRAPAAGAIGAGFLEGRLGRDDRRDRRADRREERLDRREDRREQRLERRDDLRDWRDRGGASWGRDAYRGGQVWNRGWRDDRRYDWDRYRQRNQGLYRLPRYYPPGGYGYDYRRFGLGATLTRSLLAPSYWIDDPWAYRLPPAYGPYRWVRYYDDALLIDLRTGRVVDTVYGIFY